MQDVKLYTFITLVENKNYTRTAEILNLTQPAVTQHIQHLEELYGKKLINRQGKKIDLTEAGKLVYGFGLKILKLYREMDMQLNINEEKEKSFSIGTTLSIGGYILPSLLGEFKKQYNNIDIKLNIDNSEQNIMNLVMGEIDLALIEDDFDKTRFRYEKFKEDKLVLLTHPSHEFAQKGYALIDEVIQGKLILREKGSGTRSAFEKKLNALGFGEEKLKPYMEIGNITAIISMIQSNLGYSIVSKAVVKEAINNDSVKIVPIKGVEIVREFMFVYVNNIKDKWLRAFIDFCKILEE